MNAKVLLSLLICLVWNIVVGQTDNNDLFRLELKGNVKSLKNFSYRAIKNNDVIQKGEKWTFYETVKDALK